MPNWQEALRLTGSTSSLQNESRNRLILYIIFVVNKREVLDQAAFITDGMFCSGRSTPLRLVRLDRCRLEALSPGSRRSDVFLTPPVPICYRVAGSGNVSCCISFSLVSQVRRWRLFWNRAVRFEDMPIRWNMETNRLFYIFV